MLEIVSNIMNGINNYQGQTLKVSYELHKPFCIITNDNNGTVKGIFADVVMEIASILNLTVEFQPFSERFVWGRRLENGSWAGNVGEIQKGEAHTSVGGTVVTLERSEAVDFSNALGIAVLGLTLKRPGFDDISAKNYLGEFMPISWIYIAVMFMFCFACYTTVLMLGKSRKPVVVLGIETTFLAIINKVSRLFVTVLAINVNTISGSKRQAQIFVSEDCSFQLVHNVIVADGLLQGTFESSAVYQDLSLASKFLAGGPGFAHGLIGHERNFFRRLFQTCSPWQFVQKDLRGKNQKQPRRAAKRHWRHRAPERLLETDLFQPVCENCQA